MSFISSYQIFITPDPCHPPDYGSINPTDSIITPLHPHPTDWFRDVLHISPNEFFIAPDPCHAPDYGSINPTDSIITSSHPHPTDWCRDICPISPTAFFITPDACHPPMAVSTLLISSSHHHIRTWLTDAVMSIIQRSNCFIKCTYVHAYVKKSCSVVIRFNVSPH